MPYAALDDVLGRAGKLAGAWTDTSEPSLGQVELFLRDAAAQIDAVLAARGLTVPVTDEPARAALAPLNADLACLLALESTPIASDVRDDMLDRIRDRARPELASLRKGDHAAVLVLESTADAAGSSDFWTVEPGYPTQADADAARERPSLAPNATRLMRL